MRKRREEKRRDNERERLLESVLLEKRESISSASKT